MKVYFFPGQGSQKKGMGEYLFNEFSDLTAVADEVLGYSIREVCVLNKDSLLSRTEYAQAGIFVINALSYLKEKAENGEPEFLLGHSLGEYNALCASGAFDFKTGVEIIQKRGAVMAKLKNGGMAVVKGLPVDEIQKIITVENFNTIDIANYNAPYQTVISGPKTEIIKVRPIFEKAGAQLYFPLDVDGAFHSRYMKEAFVEFSQFLSQIKFDGLKIPVVSSITAEPYVGNTANIRKTLMFQMINPVLWSASVEYLLRLGVTEFKEIGGGSSLSDTIEECNDGRSNISVKQTEDKTCEMVRDDSVNEENSVLEINNVMEAGRLGSSDYRKRYKVKYAYAAGGMYKGVSSPELVIAMGKASLMSYLGAGGIPLQKIEEDIILIQKELTLDSPYGINVVYNMYSSERENKLIDLCLRYGVKNIEAAAYMQVTASLVKFRLKGLRKTASGAIISENNIQAKISIPEIAELFLQPAPEKIVKILFEQGEITEEQMELSKYIPLAGEICIEADSGGHTDQGVLVVLLPVILRLREDCYRKYGYQYKINIGAAGGIGTPAAAAAALMLGADYIVTGSINQCTVEAGTSKSVKNILEKININDTAYAPAGDMFEIGARVQVVKRGTFFPVRANRLFEIYNQHASLLDINDFEKEQLESKCFGKTFEQVYEECRAYHGEIEINKAERDPKYKMAMVFKWYFGFSSKAALSGDESNTVNYQIHCGPALGAFNQWVKGTPLERWENRKTPEIAIAILGATARYLAGFMDKMNVYPCE